ncbi:hypothetical protein OC835_007846 [Tilletia horrida]|nr:hypothetical protein OC835_007846 [Tilletia horrida]
MPPPNETKIDPNAGQQPVAEEPTLRDVMSALAQLGQKVGTLEQLAERVSTLEQRSFGAPAAQSRNISGVLPRDDPFGPGPGLAPAGPAPPDAKQDLRIASQDARLQAVVAQGGIHQGGRYLPYGSYTPTLRPGPNPGPQGLTPANDPTRVRGVSGLMIPITPHSRSNARAPTAEAADRAIDTRTPAKERAEAARVAFTDAYRAFCQRLFPVYFRHAEVRSPGATDDQLIAEVEKQLALDWEEQQRGGSKGAAPGGITTVSSFRQSRISTQPFKDVTKLTRKNWRDWISEIQAHLSAIPYANEHLEGIIHGEKYDPDRPDFVHELYDPQLDKEIGAVLLGTIDPSCRAPIFNLQGTGEHRGSLFYRAVLQYVRRSDSHSRMQIRHKIWDEQQDTKETVETYGERLRGLFLELQSLGAVVPEEDQIDYLLKGVNRRLLITQQQVVDDHHSGKVTTFEEALTRLIRAENALEVFRREPTHTSASAQRAEAVSGRMDGMREPRRALPGGGVSGGNKGAKGKMGSGCFWCGAMEHRIAKCPKLEEDKRAGRVRGTALDNVRALIVRCGELDPEEDELDGLAGGGTVGQFEVLGPEDELMRASVDPAGDHFEAGGAGANAFVVGTARH